MGHQRRIRILAAAVAGLCLVARGLPARADIVSWSGGAGTLNWGDDMNWAGGTPAGNDVAFGSGGATAANVISNIVNSSFSIDSLSYAYGLETPAGLSHTTQIPAATTLNVTGVQGLGVGLISYTSAADVTTVATITGAGTLNISNTNAAVVVTNDWSAAGSGSNTGMAQLNLAGLSNFTANVRSVLIGTAADGSAGGGVRSSGMMILGATNTISAGSLNVGWANGEARSSTLLMGVKNTINVDAVRIGVGESNGYIGFDANRANATLALRGKSGIYIGQFTVGDRSMETASDNNTSSQADFSAGEFDSNIENLVIGSGLAGDGAGSSTALFSMRKGDLEVHTITIGQTSGGASAARSQATGKLIMSGASDYSFINANKILIADQHGAGLASGILEIDVGTLSMSGDISDGGGDSTIAVGAAGDISLRTSSQGTPHNIGSAASPIDHLLLDGKIENANDIHVREVTGQGNISGVLGTLSLMPTGSMTFSAKVTGNRLEIASGTVALASSANVTGVANFRVLSGAALDASAKLPLSVAGITQTFSGSGSVQGTLDLKSNFVIYPGSDGVAGTLTFSDTLQSEGAIIKFDLSNTTAEGNGINDLINAKNLVMPSTGIYINPLMGNLANGTYRLINYSGTMNATLENIQLSGPVVGARQSATLDFSTPHQINLIISGNPSKSLTWTGAQSSNWKLNGDANFIDQGNASDKFYNLDTVTFDDTSTNTANVALQGAITPAAVIVTGNRDYTFSGNGGLTGHTSLYKSGSGTLTLAYGGANNFDGPVTIAGGTLAMAGLFQGPTSDLGGTPDSASRLIIDGGTFRYKGSAITTDRLFTMGSNGATIDASGTGAIVFSNTGPLGMRGGGARTLTLTGLSTALNQFYGSIADADAPTSVVKDGPGTWMLRGGSFTGGVTVKAGILRGYLAPSTGVAVLPGATFDIYGLVEGEPVIASGTGANGIGAIINTGNDSLQALGQLTLSGDITINTAFRTDIRGNAAALSTSGHDYKLTKSGAGQFSIVYATVDPALGDIDVQAGIIDFEGTTTSMGNPANTISIATNATLQFWNLLSPADKKLTLNGTFQSGLGVANTFVGPITLGAASKFDTINTSILTVSGVISGDGNGITKTGDGTLVLTAANHYTGATAVSAGTLRVLGSVADSSQVVVNNSATFDAASTQKLIALTVNSGGTALVSGGTLKIGSGANASPLTIAATGSIDLSTHALIVDSPTGDETATLQLIRGQIIGGYNHGDWLGKGISSSAAAADHGKAIGYARVSDVLAGGSDSLLGQSVDGTEIVARYTVAGDTNLDGVVSFADLVVVAQHYGMTLNDNVNAPSAFTDSWWTHGDLNYDGQVNFADLVIVAQNYGGGLADTVVGGASAQFAADLANITASAPEPTIGLAGVVFVGLSLLRRRRGRN